MKSFKKYLSDADAFTKGMSYYDILDQINQRVTTVRHFHINIQKNKEKHNINYYINI